MNGVPCGPLIRPTGTFAWVEPPVSTRPSDPRGEKRGSRRCDISPSPQRGEGGPKGRMRGLHGTRLASSPKAQRSPGPRAA
ncbi:hypothetical protein GFL63_17840 [Rhizobium leguminosarum bv. viciae]|nr:hypothetical protein [Rhizobium leguminosarum bv. viciae]